MRGSGGRVLLVAGMLCAAAPAADADESRLGGLIRWYLNEPSPRKREDFLEAIEKLTGGDPRVVAAAIRNGEHFRHHPRPSLRKGGKPPVFDEERAFEYDRLRRAIEESAGDVAVLTLPEGYDPRRAWPVVVDVDGQIPGHPLRLPVPAGAVHLRVAVRAHPQAKTHAWAAEQLVLGLVAHLVDLVHVDPERIVLRGDGIPSALVWYIALHNPDRFAGAMGTRWAWTAGADLAPNARTFRALGLRAEGKDGKLQVFFDALRAQGPLHRALEGPEDDLAFFRAVMDDWWQVAVRPETPVRLDLVSRRGAALRSHWIRMVPYAPQRRGQGQAVGKGWSHRVQSRPARLEARIVLNDPEPNLVRITTERVVAFEILVDPELFDLRHPLRVQVNDAPAPQAKLIHLEIAHLLEDYRDRRDTRILPVARLTIPVR